MATNAHLAAKLLRDASGFFRNVGEQNPPLQQQMEDNAQVYDQVAELVESDPNGELPTQDEAAAGDAQPQ
ncbi:hypothetical protein GRI72_10480 [Altererythrobacter marinus]|jgi:hypothetical protein|uniref:Uncharacterized protein n=1 Tax=Pelagerythrobacter marinus TaxID=538382 RepID=A0ABW9UZH5_9SPHN|nr:hypothetical protein [Pelagerythrobacter marinus]MEC9066785.1 hypothetical protein [Pseudomonadota bacterium]MXO69252.1 hypothetical protein [Pelagerythrobacter marinus]